MKIFWLLYLTLIAFSANAQEKFFGNYQDYFTDELGINSDSTFKYTFRFDLEYSWTKGTWKVSNDTIYFKTILIFDTIRYKDEKTKLIVDSLFLSIDEKPNLGFDSIFFYIDGKKELAQVENFKVQNTHLAPERLFYRKHKLYIILKNGKLRKDKFRAFWTNKKYPTWYIRKSDN